MRSSDKPNCFDCKNSNTYSGHETRHEPPHPPIADCKFEGLQIELLEEIDTKQSVNNYEIIAKRCNKFNPIIVEECTHCQEEMSIPLYQVEYWGYNGWVMVPCCSQECVDYMDDKVKLRKRRC